MLTNPTARSTVLYSISYIQGGTSIEIFGCIANKLQVREEEKIKVEHRFQMIILCATNARARMSFVIVVTTAVMNPCPFIYYSIRTFVPILFCMNFWIISGHWAFLNYAAVLPSSIFNFFHLIEVIWNSCVQEYTTRQQLVLTHDILFHSLFRNRDNFKRSRLEIQVENIYWIFFVFDCVQT